MDRGREGKKRGRVNQREEGCRLFPGKDLQQEDVYFEGYSLDFFQHQKDVHFEISPHGNSN